MLPAIAPAPLQLPDINVVVLNGTDLVCLTPDGEVETMPIASAASWLHGRHVMLCNARFMSRRLGLERLAAHDVLELFAFARPAVPAVPTPRGLAAALGLAEPQNAAQTCIVISQIAGTLLQEIAAAKDPQLAALAAGMKKGGWVWADYILHACGVNDDAITIDTIRRAVTVWRHLPEWHQDALPGPAGTEPVLPLEARKRLSLLVDRTVHGNSEPRPEQADYTSAASFAFAPREEAGVPQAVMAEAGTGVGKTLGYLAPATLWAERNKAPVWVSTYTRNLQRQIDQALHEHYDDPVEAKERVVVRKGRENYLCLLNLEEALRSTVLHPTISVPLGLMLRWASVTRDGDFSGDFPFWLTDLFGKPRTTGLSDRRGECIYAACDHYTRCFIEHSIRAAKTADIVIANHALVMIQAANNGLDDANTPLRYVFDEGHHLFSSADSAFSSRLSGIEAAELRRWLIGAETSNRTRARGLRRRLGEILVDYPALEQSVDRIVHAATQLPAEGWLNRLGSNAGVGAIEIFLGLVRQQVYARSAENQSAYSLECEVAPGIEGLKQASGNAVTALGNLIAPLTMLIKALKALLDDEAATLAEDKRRKIEAMARSLHLRAWTTANNWRAMLLAIDAETPPDFVDWFEIDRMEGRDFDTAFCRHYIDPTKPFAEIMATQAHGLLITSATLTDSSGDTERDWQAAEELTGSRYLPKPALRAKVTSPFPYKEMTRIYIVRNVQKNDIDQVAAAYRELFTASKGGGLGLFTSIQRLQAVHERIAAPLENAGINLYAQHIDGLNPTTLVDIFRAEENSCLLGTDAIRDGVDVPGRALRLIVFDRVPWSRPDILYKARREAFGGAAYEDRLTRLRLKQAFGRLIRRTSDRGVFVLLDSMLPSRLTTAFPPEVAVIRTGLAEAIAGTRDFLEL